jgi:hypothetical protein
MTSRAQNPQQQGATEVTVLGVLRGAPVCGIHSPASALNLQWREGTTVIILDNGSSRPATLLTEHSIIQVLD